MEVFKTENLTYLYPDMTGYAMENINLTVQDGEFVLLLGGSGCGKSSLLRALAGLIPSFYGGKIGGRVLYRGKNVATMERRQLARHVGIVFQDPEKQLVKTRVEDEIAFGLENLGIPEEDMKRRVAEVINFFGLSGVKDSVVTELSGGQKQKVVLASIMAMQPKVLLLDEPTSQLDPVAAEEVFNTIKRLNEELGITIILVEQRLERCFHLADRVVIMEKGRIKQEGCPENIAKWAVDNQANFIPPVAQFFATIDCKGLPLTVREGRRKLREIGFTTRDDNETQVVSKPLFRTLRERLTKKLEKKAAPEPVVKIENVWYGYAKDNHVLKGVSLDIQKDDFMIILGENGAGKSTLLRTINGLLTPDRGAVYVNGSSIAELKTEKLASTIGYLGQNPNDYLFHDTVEEELLFTLNNLGLEDEGKIDRILNWLGISQFRKCNPRDLSGGQRQRVALASVLVAEPKVLLLDEPTRGLDIDLKNQLGRLLKSISENGTTVIMITHDVEFAAQYGQQVTVLFDGQVVASGDKYNVLNDSIFYSPQIQKLFRGFEPGVLRVQDALARWEGFKVEVG